MEKTECFGKALQRSTQATYRKMHHMLQPIPPLWRISLSSTAGAPQSKRWKKKLWPGVSGFFGGGAAAMIARLFSGGGGGYGCWLSWRSILDPRDGSGGEDPFSVESEVYKHFWLRDCD
ncbi:hypothetical protein LWI29_035047 [Acer saccharum]|uniref:Uncharacterized protein n=1 Tax=Acer saccharum TaxID=4024 RepID=A0AA39SL87_ACESA|nr:hypothetical protein LWI29_035047 [Acer saccharum]KAK1572587.1 hypothetical protein Q3G72_034932 [Acer saccharum]